MRLNVKHRNMVDDILHVYQGMNAVSSYTKRFNNGHWDEREGRCHVYLEALADGFFNQLEGILKESVRPEYTREKTPNENFTEYIEETREIRENMKAKKKAILEEDDLSQF